MEDVMTAAEQQAQVEVNFFACRFRSYYGEGHIILAWHAAFPIILTVDLLYQLWANFKTYTGDDGKEEIIPMLAVSDLLLSSLFRQTGRDLYEMQPELRAYLLEQLKNDPRFGPKRMELLARFLRAYVKEQPDRPEWKNFKEAQQWTALLTDDPETAARSVLQSLLQQVSGAQVNTSIGIANLIAAFAKDNQSFAKEIAGQLQEMPVENAPAPVLTVAQDGSKKLVLTSRQQAGGVSIPVNLPPHISDKLGEVKEIVRVDDAPSVINVQDGTVYGLFIGINDYGNSDQSLQGAAGDAMHLSSSLLETGFLKEDHSHVILNKDASKGAILEVMSRLLLNAQANDIVIVYFSGHAIDDGKKSLLILPGYFPERTEGDEPSVDSSQAISPHDFQRVIYGSKRDDVTIILVLDTHSGNPEWLPRHPKHFLWMASHPEQLVGDEKGGGYFTNALTKAFRESTNQVTHRELYRKVCENLLQQGAHRIWQQAPRFIAPNWDRHVFSNSSQSYIQEEQILLSELGYPLTVDGVNGPATINAREQVMTEYDIKEADKVLFYLKLKKKLDSQPNINMLIITETPWALDLDTALSHTPIVTEKHSLTELFDVAKKSTVHTAQENLGMIEFDRKLLNADVIMISVAAPVANNGKEYRCLEMLLNLAFALEKEVLLFMSRDLGLWQDFKTLYSSIIWNAVAEPMSPYQSWSAGEIDKYSEFIQHLKSPAEDIQNSNADDPVAAAVREAQVTKKLYLNDLHFSEFPGVITEIENLEELHLEGNNIRVISHFIGECKQLKVLNLNGNPITRLPDELFTLSELEVLSLSNTNLQELPEKVDQLTALRELRLHSTPLVILPLTLANLEHLTILDARMSPIINVPENVLGHSNAPERLRSFLNTFPRTRQKIVLVSQDPKDTGYLKEQLTAARVKVNQIVVGAIDLSYLFAVGRFSARPPCLLYLHDPEGRIFEELKSSLQSIQLAATQSYWKLFPAISFTLIYDGVVKKKTDYDNLLKLPFINAVIAQYSTASSVTRSMILSKYFDHIANGLSVSDSFTALGKEKGSDKRGPYEWLESKTFKDWSVRPSPGEKPFKYAGKAPYMDEILPRIEEAKKSRKLNLKGLGLTEIPREVFGMKQLVSLDISVNNITVIPSQIKALTNLEEFTCNGTPVSELPEGFFSLTKLQKIMMDGSELVEIPQHILALKQLKEFHFGKTKVRSLPLELIQLPLLNKINAADLTLINIPDAILAGNMKSVRKYFMRTSIKKDQQQILYVKSFSRSKERTIYEKIFRDHLSKERIKELHQCKTLTQMAAFIQENITEKTILIVDDKNGVLTNQFNEALMMDMVNYFRTFHYPMHIIYDGPLKSRKALFHLASERYANTSISFNKDSSMDSSLIGLLFELMKEANISYFEAVQFYLKYLYAPSDRTKGAESRSVLPYFVVYSYQEFDQKLYAKGMNGRKKGWPPVRIIEESAYVSRKDLDTLISLVHKASEKVQAPAKKKAASPAQKKAASPAKKTSKQASKSKAPATKKTPAKKSSPAKKAKRKK